MENLKLADATIAQIAKCVQVAILTGTDVVDHLRQLELTTDENNKITVTEEYLLLFEKNIEKMLAEAAENNNDCDDGQQISLF